MTDQSDTPLADKLSADKTLADKPLAGTPVTGALHDQLISLSNGEVLSSSQVAKALDAILMGAASDIEVAGFLMGLRARGETSIEIAAAATTMRARAVPVLVDPAIMDQLVDTCGTGGDGANTVNISTAAAIVAAGAGAPVAKHGNRAASSKSGSSDVIAALGVNLDASPDQISACFDGAGVGFMFAQRHHGATAKVMPVRKALGVRTIFNLLGPLSNPAGAKRQLLGVFDRSFLVPMAEALAELGSTRAWIVHGADGLDELTIADKSYVASLENGRVDCFEITPEDAGLTRHSLDDLRGGLASDNAKRLSAVLDGEKGAYRDVTILNAAATLLIAGIAKTLKEGAEKATASIDNGAARHTLEQLVRLSHQA